MNNYFKFSKLNIFNDDFILKACKPYPSRHTKVEELTKYLTPQFKEYLSSVNLAVHLCEVFYYGPFESLDIHIDGSYMNDRCKINIIYGGRKSHMVWYAPKDNTATFKIDETPIGTQYLKYQENDLVILELAELQGANVVKVGIPHSIQNYRQPRICFSMPLIYADTKKSASFDYVSTVLQ